MKFIRIFGMRVPEEKNWMAAISIRTNILVLSISIAEYGTSLLPSQILRWHRRVFRLLNEATAGASEYSGDTFIGGTQLSKGI